MSLTGLLPRLLVLIAALMFLIVVQNSELLRFYVCFFYLLGLLFLVSFKGSHDPRGFRCSDVHCDSLMRKILNHSHVVVMVTLTQPHAEGVAKVASCPSCYGSAPCKSTRMRLHYKKNAFWEKRRGF